MRTGSRMASRFMTLCSNTLANRQQAKSRIRKDSSNESEVNLRSRSNPAKRAHVGPNPNNKEKTVKTKQQCSSRLEGCRRRYGTFWAGPAGWRAQIRHAAQGSECDCQWSAGETRARAGLVGCI